MIQQTWYVNQAVTYLNFVGIFCIGLKNNLGLVKWIIIRRNDITLNFM